MSNKRQQRIRKNGIFYTPESVAELLVSQAIEVGGLSILDPACGEGALLKAAVEESKKFRNARRPRLVGCDRFKPQNIDQCIEFVHSDFFAYKAEEKFDIVMTNPPYVQTSRIDKKTRKKYFEKYAEKMGFSSNLDLWVYFLIKCTMHLKKGGTIAAVLPWSFLEAEYAQNVRRWIAGNFMSVRVLVLQGAHFAETVKRVLLIWLEGYGSRSQRVQLGCANECTRKPNFRELPMEIWDSKNVMAGLNPGTDDISRKLRAAGFRPLEEYADVSIGIVTGANSYFIQTRQEAAKLGFSQGSILPILTSVEDLRQLAECKSPDKMLIRFNRISEKKKQYICKGVNLEFDQRTHCQRREKQNGVWYDVNPGEVPDAFFTYRVSTLPYLILNPDGYQCTNALHKVFFNGIPKTKRKWIQLSLLSLFGQLWLEAGARHDGNGIIKVEPSTLKRTLVYAGGTRITKGAYQNILRDIASGRKKSACTEATKLIVSETKIDKSIITDILASLNKIRKRRGAATL